MDQTEALKVQQQQQLEQLIAEPPLEHFYFYPKTDSKEERRTFRMIASLPKAASPLAANIYTSMVEAKQNCEAIAFRGQRLLHQMAAHWREELSKAEEREHELQYQLSEYEQRCQEQEAQLQSYMMVLQGLGGLDLSSLLS